MTNDTHARPPADPTFETFVRALREALRERVARDWPAYRNALFAIGDGFVARTRSDMARWTGLMATGALTRDDFEWLVYGRRELAELEALRLAGLSLAQIDRFRSALVETIVGTAFRHFL